MQPMLGGDTGGHFATNGGFGGTGLPAPHKADIQQGTTLGDVTGAQNNAGQSLEAQKALLAALQSQGGLNAQNQAMSGLQNTASMYQNIAQGNGPNPAQAALNQATGQNVANQAAMMAGQRGASANVGLMARQAAQQGAATQQQAVGQGATLQAQQQMNALSGLGGIQGQQAGLANTMAGQQIGQVNANSQSNLANQQAMQQGLSNYNQQNITNQGNLMNARAGLQTAYIDSQKQGLTNLSKSMGGGGNMAGAGMMGAEGGDVQMAAGGNVFAESNPYGSGIGDDSSPQSSFGKFLYRPSGVEDIGDPYNKNKAPNKSQPQTAPTVDSGSAATMDDSSFSPETMKAEGGLADRGGHVAAKNPSQKAVKSGNDYANDKIPARLSEGEIVLPRTVTMSKDPVNDAAKFVAQVLAKRKAKR